MNLEYGKIIYLMCHSCDDAWADAALDFIQAASEAGEHTITPVFDEAGTQTGWRNFSFRPAHEASALGLPSDFKEHKL